MQPSFSFPYDESDNSIPPSAQPPSQNPADRYAILAFRQALWNYINGVNSIILYPGDIAGTSRFSLTSSSLTSFRQSRRIRRRRRREVCPPNVEDRTVVSVSKIWSTFLKNLMHDENYSIILV